MTAVFLAFNGGMLWWFLAVKASLEGCSITRCHSALALAYPLTLWAFGALFLAVLWLSVERRLGLRTLRDRGGPGGVRDDSKGPRPDADPD